jgi:hypothetical protein
MPNGKKAKACTDHKRLAVVAAEDPEGAVYLLQVTPSALGGLNQYHKELSRHGVSPNMVITNIGFDSKASYPKLTFSYGGFLDEEAYNTVADRVQSDEVLEIIGMQPKQSAPVVEDEDEDEYVQEVIAEPVEAPKPKAKKGFGGSSDEPKPKAKAKPTPVVEDDEDEDDDSGVAVIEDLTELGDLFGD